MDEQTHEASVLLDLRPGDKNLTILFEIWRTLET